ncbi:hypothetical protein PI126_g19469 [Phytophthora idaei]|nr:hypothetical protein PI126_g19469 [Phytophthora idaei]
MLLALAPAVFALSSDVDFSDGSNVAIDQPLLNATDWFLTEQEITDSRRGVPRSDLSVYTTGNAIKSFAITKEYFDSVYDDLSAAGEGERIMLAAWDSKLVPLKPDVDVTGATSGYHNVFAGVVERGGEVSILAWANLLRRGHNIEARTATNSLPASPVNGARATFIFDDRVRSISASHHQKTLVIVANSSSGDDDHPIAYVGGLDLTNDRWDTIYHNNSALRDAAGITFRHKEFKQLAPLNYASSNTTSKLGTQSVQIVRTFNCKYKHYTEFAPNGETSLFHARIKAIKNARNYIYIEDQYFILVPELFDALMEVIPRLQKVIVVAHAPIGQIKVIGYERYFYDMVSPFQKKYPNKFKVYTTKLARDIYIHSKIVIIDDVYLSVGSANWNRRSLTSDSELNANVVDDDTVESPDGITVNKLARDFRIRKFHEMTGVGYDKLDAMTFLDVAAADNSSLLQALEAEYQLYYVGFTDLIRQQADPQDSCT